MNRAGRIVYDWLIGDHAEVAERWYQISLALLLAALLAIQCAIGWSAP